MKIGSNKDELRKLRKQSNVVWVILAIIVFSALFILYLFMRPTILEEYCMPRAREAAKSYKEQLIAPPRDLIEEYKNNASIIDENSRPTPYYVELLRCEISLSKRLYPFLHTKTNSY